MSTTTSTHACAAACAAAVPGSFSESTADDARPRDSRLANGWWPGLPDMGTHADPMLGCIELPTDDSDATRACADGLRLSLATSAQQLDKVTALRQAAYGRHGYPALPGVEHHDGIRGTAVLLVEDEHGEAIATMRTCMGIDGPAPWSQGIELPESFGDRRIAYFERLAVKRADKRVAQAKQMLFKAAWLLALSCRIEVVVVATISPLDRLFASIGFRNVFGPGQTRRVPWHPAEFNVMQMELDSLARMCLRSNPAWYFHCTTPDSAIEALVQDFRNGAGMPATASAMTAPVTGFSIKRGQIGSIV